MSIKVTFDSELFNVSLKTDDPYTLETITSEFGKMVTEAAVVAANTPVTADAEDE